MNYTQSGDRKTSFGGDGGYILFLDKDLKVAES
jgi:hypothetical protein